jgi:hypothetical protein
VDLEGGGQALDLPENWRLWQDVTQDMQEKPCAQCPSWEYRTEVVAADCLYQVVSPDGDFRESWHCLDDLGCEGWELVTVLPDQQSSWWIGFFKRPLSI